MMRTDGTITYTHSVSDGLVCPVGWLASPKPPSGDRFELAPGIWIVREKQWWPISVLDTAELAPPPLDVEPIHRIFPFVDWHERAACRASDAEALPNSDAIFFGVDDAHHPALPPRKIAEARALCAICPEARRCLTDALSMPEEFGIWGGLTGRQRVKLQLRIRAGETIEELVDECLPA